MITARRPQERAAIGYRSACERLASGAALTRIWLTFLGGAFGIACAAIFVRVALPAPPVVTGFYRMLFASIVLAAWTALRGRTSGRSSPAAGAPRFGSRDGLVATGAGLCFGTDIALWHLSLVETSVANATLLVNTTPLYVGLYTWAALGRRLSPGFVAGAALAVAGTAVLLGVDLARTGAARGDLLALSAALFYAGYLLLMKSARRVLDALHAVLLASLSATAVLGLYAALLGGPFSGFPSRSWLAMLAAALVSQVGGVFAIAWSLRFLPATFASVGLLAQPVAAAGLGWALLGETLEPLQLAGALAVLAGIYVAARGRDLDA